MALCALIHHARARGTRQLLNVGGGHARLRTRSTVLRIRSKVDFAAVQGVAVAVRVAVGALPNLARPCLARCRGLRQLTGRAARTAVRRIRCELDFAPVSNLTVAVAEPRLARSAEIRADVASPMRKRRAVRIRRAKSRRFVDLKVCR